MAEISDAGSFWRLSIYEPTRSVKQVETINEPDKGYKAVIGYDSGKEKHVVMSVEYDKSKYTIDDVYKKVDQLRNCNRCNTLDKEKLNIERVKFSSEPATGESSEDAQFRAVDISPSAELADQGQKLRSKSGIKDWMADAFFQTYFTAPGMYFMGLMTGDDSMVDAAIPKDPEGMMEFMEQLMGFWSGDVDFVRSPEEAKEHLELMKQSMVGNAVEASAVRVRKTGKQKTREVNRSMIVY